jgi:hypothetical protein
LAAAASRCRSWGWPISLTGSRVLLSTGAQVSAVEFAEGLAGEVQRFLTMRMLSGPVVALPGAPRRWLLLAASADEAPQATIDRLAGRGGVTPRAGRPVVAAVDRHHRRGPLDHPPAGDAMTAASVVALAVLAFRSHHWRTGSRYVHHAAVRAARRMPFGLRVQVPVPILVTGQVSGNPENAPPDRRRAPGRKDPGW